MSDLLFEILILMSCTFLLGLLLGWLVWRFGNSKAHLSEIDFWKTRFDEARQKRDVDQDIIEGLKRDTEKMKTQLMSNAS